MSALSLTMPRVSLTLELGLASFRLGIDIGGSGVKYALVDTTEGKLVSERKRIKTPDPATPEAVTEVVAEVIDSTSAEGPIGVGFPAVVWNGNVFSANNIDKGWIGRNARDEFARASGSEIVLLNDADAAGIAESGFGAAQGVEGLALVITFGTGIGSGAIFRGELVPNFELGVIELDGHYPAELYFSAKVRKREDLSWEVWGGRVNRFLSHVNGVLNPELMVFGGGVTKHWEKFSPFIDDDLPVVPASMGNNAGLIGAALAAAL
jgi:polyphosphate glucokinase